MSSASARLLKSDELHRVRFNPNSNFNGTATIQYRAWDQVNGVDGDLVDLRRVEGGGWALVAYGANASLGGSLIAAAGNFSPSVRTGSAVLPALNLLKSSAELAMSWTGVNGGFPVGGIASYNHAVAFALPNASVMSFDGSAASPPVYGASFNAAISFAVGSTHQDQSLVTVQTLTGSPGMPDQMYLRNKSFGAGYGGVYGLVLNDGSNPQLDYGQFPDDQTFKAIYLDHGTGDGQRTGLVMSGAGGARNSYVPSTMALWARLDNAQIQSFVGSSISGSGNYNLVNVGTTYIDVIVSDSSASFSASTATGTITVSAVNDVPVATAQSVTTDEDTAKAITLAGTDVEGATLTYTVVMQPTKGVLSGTAPNLTYTPNTNVNGTDSFTFTVNDGTLDSAAATVSITVGAVNDVPAATAQSVTIAEDTAKAITLAGTDVEGAALTYTVVAQPTKGVLSGTAPNLTYTPNANVNGIDSFTFTVSDGTLDSAAATVTMTLAVANVAPTLDLGISAVGGTTTSASGYNIHHYTGAGVFTPSFSGSIEVLVVGGGGGGGSGGGGGGGVVYQAAYTVAAGQAIAVQVGAGGGVDPSQGRALTGTNGGNSTFGSIVGYGGGGGGGAGLSGLSGASSGGTGADTAAASGQATQGFRGANGAANDGYVGGGGGGGAGGVGTRGLYGADGYGYSTSSSPGGNGGIGAMHAISGAQTYYGGGGGGGPNTNAADTVTGGSGGLGGGGNGARRDRGPGLAAAANTGGGGGGGDYEGLGGPGGSGIVIVRYLANAVNYVETGAAGTFATMTGTLVGADVDAGTTLTYGISGETASSGVATKVGTYGTLAVTTASGAYSFTPNAAAINAISATTTETFTVTLGDGTATTTASLVIRLTALNDAPVLSAIAVSGTEDTTVTVTAANFTAAYTDAQSTPLVSITVATLPTMGLLKLSGTNVTANQVIALADLPNLTYVPAAHENGAKTFTVTASDGTTSSATATVTMTLAAVNDAPVAAASTVSSIVKDVADGSNPGTLVSALVTNFTDPDSGAVKGLAVTAVVTTNGTWQYSTDTGTTWLTLTGVSTSAARLLKGDDANYKVRFVPSANFYGTATLTYQAWDQTSGTAGGTAAVTTNGGSTAYSSNAGTGTITVAAAGTLWAWGNNYYGQLGDGTTTDRTSPVQSGSAASWQSVAAGNYFTVAVQTDGALWSWGDSRAVSPVRIGTATSWQSVAAGVAVRTDGTLWALGGVGVSPVQIGSETSWQSAAAGVAVRTDGTLWALGGVGVSPVQIGSETSWQSVSAGYGFKLAVRTDGTLWAWGSNAYGQLGDGTTTSRTSPVQIGSATPWQSVAAGSYHTVAVRTDGTLWAWGSNASGKLGDGTTTDRTSPVQIGSATSWQSVAAGYGHTVAVRTDGTLWAWGWNNNGQLGDGTTTGRISPVQIGAWTSWQSVSAGEYHTLAVQAVTPPEIAVTGNSVSIPDGASTPTMTNHTDFGSTPVTGGTVVRTFTIANSGTTSLTLSGTPKLAVSGTHAADFTVTAVPTSPVTASGSTTFRVTFDPSATGTRTATLTIANDDSDESIYDFAIQGTGATSAPEIDVIGNNSVSITDGASTPTTTNRTDFGSAVLTVDTVVRTFTIANRGTASLSLSGTPLVAVSGAHAADFTVTALPTSPVTASGSTTFQVAFSPGATGTRTATLTIANDDSDEGPYDFAIRGTGVNRAGTLWAWGGNGYGQVGDGTTTTRTSPVWVGAATSWQSVAAGGSHTVAVRTDGTLWAWGYNLYGQLGDGTNTDRTGPVQIGLATTWQSVAAGSQHIVAVQVPAPEINVTGNSVSILDGDSTPSTTDHTDFGSALVTGGTVVRTFTIANNGTVSLTLSGTPKVAVSGTHAADFTVTTLPTSPVTAIGSTTLQVTFSPSATGTRTAKLTIANNDSDEGIYDFAIQGTGATPAPEINVTGNSGSITDGASTPTTTNHTDFGSALVTGGTVVRTFTIANTGTGSLTLSGTPLVAVSGTHAADFTVTALPTSPVAASGSTTFQVTFDPSATGTRTATLSLTSDVGIYDFAIQGTGRIIAGTLWAWGYNGYGVLGDGTNTGRTSPVQIGFTPSWQSVAAGDYHTVAVRTDGTLWAWGYNGYGVLGDGGSSTNRNRPFQIGTETSWQSVAAGSQHTVAVRTDGTLWAWGDNYDGRLGDGTTTTRNSPVQIGTETSWQSVAAGESHTVAVRTDGTLWAWGNNGYGQVGDGTTATRTSPVKIGSETTWQSVAAGFSYSVAVRTDGTLWAWGRNAAGQLGDGTTVNSSSPVRIGTATSWQSVAAGFSYSVAVRTDGTLWAWGANGYGQVGDGTTATRTSPVQIGSETSWKSVAAGSQHTVAVRTDGTLWAWGYNGEGQLGDGTTTGRTSPAQVGSATSWQFAEAGRYYTMAVQFRPTPIFNVSGNRVSIADGASTPTTTDHTEFGSALVTGGTVVRTFTIANNGTGSLTLSGTPLVAVSGPHAADFTVTAVPTSPVTANGSTTFQVTFDPRATGTRSATLTIVSDQGVYDFAIQGTGVNNAGTLWAWGYNWHGQVGDGTNTDRTSPVQIGSETSWKSVDAGSIHNVAVRTDGTLWGWGYNANYQLSDGTTTNRNSPVQIGTATSWQSVAAGTYHTVAVQNNGTLLAWGHNSSGQLGVGLEMDSNYNITTPNRTIPTSVLWDTFSVAAGFGHTVAVKTDGTLWAWGANGYGQVGDGTIQTGAERDPYVKKASPIRIGSATTWQSVAVGGSHTVAVRTDGTLWAWGNNNSGQMGDGTNTDRTSPVQIGSETTWQSVAAGDYHTLAVRTDGTLWAWGNNYHGQVGDGTTTTRTSPVQIGSATTWQSVAAGAYHNVAVRADGTLWAWGFNRESQLGDGTTTTRTSPVRIGTATTWQSVSAGSSHTVAVQAATPAPEINVTGNSVSILDGDSTPSTTDHTDFGSAALTGGTVVRTFTIANNGTGSLTLSGTPKVAVSGTHAADFTVTALPTSPVVASGSTTFQVTFDPSATGTRTATLTLANDDSDEGTYDFAIQGTVVNIEPTLAAIPVSGTEDTTLTFTAAKFTAAYTDAESTPLASITVATLPATGLLKLSGSDVTASQVIPSANLGNLTYVPAANENGAKTFTVTASDGTASSATATVTMTLAAVNDAPVFSGSNVDASLPSLSEGAASGSITGQTIGSLVGSLFSDSADAVGGGTANTLAGIGIAHYFYNGRGIDWTNWNDPIKGEWQYSADSGSTWTRIPNLDSHTWNWMPRLNLSDLVRFVPVADFYGIAPALPFRLIETPGSFASGSIDGGGYYGLATRYGADRGTITQSITAVANIVADSLSVTRGGSVTANLITGTNGASADNFEDASRAITAVTQGSNGVVTFNADGTVTYTPAANWIGTDTFTYTVTSGLVTETATVTVAVNAAPNVAAPASFALREDVVGNLTFTGTPFADADSATLTVTLSVSDGTITGNAGTGITVGGTATALTLAGTLADLNTYFTTAGSLTYQGVLDNTTSRTLTIAVSDGTHSASATSAINFTAVNDAPTLAAIPVSGTEDTTLTLTAANFTAAYTDAESTPLVSITVVTLPATGLLKLSGTDVAASQVILAAALGNLTYMPAANENGAKTFTVTASDGTTSSAAETVTMTLAAVNDAPVITSNGGGAAAAINVAENTTAVTTVVATDADVGQTVTYSITGGADSAKFSVVAATGVLTFTTAPNFEVPTDVGANNVYDLIVTATDDESPVGTKTQFIAVTVTNANEAPVITSSGSTSYAENATGSIYTATGSDPESAPLSYTLGGADAALFDINAASGAVTFEVSPNFEAAGDSGADNVYDITVTASDGDLSSAAQAVAITVTNVNDAPVITSNGGGAIAAINVAENTTAVTTVVATDADVGQTVTYSITGGADSAKFSVVAATGVLTFSSAPNFEVPTDGGADNVYDLIVTATDDGSPVDTKTQTIAVTVTNANEAPVITGNSVSIPDGDSTPSTTDHTDFGSAALTGGTVVRTFTIANNGTGSLTLSGTPKVAVSGIHAADFTVTALPTSPVTASGSTTFQVTFDPSATGTRTATLSIANDDSGVGIYDFAIQGTGVSLFATWQTLNGASGTLTADHDNDGVPNGIEYFVGGPNGKTTGQTTLPSILNSSGTLSITWIKGTGYPGVYGSDYLIETTTTLTGTWTPETVGVNVTLTGNNVTYTFPATSGDRRFVRLKVMAP